MGVRQKLKFAFLFVILKVLLFALAGYVVARADHLDQSELCTISGTKVID